MQGLTVWELAFIKILRARVPDAGPMHLKAMLALLREKQSYLTLDEIETSTAIHNGELKKIMQDFTATQLVEKEGCLFRKPENKKVIEIVMA